MNSISKQGDVTEKVAQQIGLDDPTKIRSMVANQVSDILYFDALDIPLPELPVLKTLKVAFHNFKTEQVAVLNVRLPKQSSVGDVLNELKSKVKLSNPKAELRILEVFYHKIYKAFSFNEKIENINDRYWTLRAEEIPDEEKNLGPQDRLIHVYHFMREPGQNQMLRTFGEPFFLVIRENETLQAIKSRIQKKLEVPDEEILKWKFACVSLGRPEYFTDDDIVGGRFQKKETYIAWDHYLGLEHADSSLKKSHQANQVVHFRRLDKPKEDEFSLELSKQNLYDDVTEKVAQQVGLDDPTKIRLTTHNCFTQQPKPQPIKYRGVERLGDMLIHHNQVANQVSDILYFEVLNIPLPELQGLKTLKVAFHNFKTEEVTKHNVWLPKQSTVRDVLKELRAKVELSKPKAELRILEVFYHKIYKIFHLNEKIENMNDQYWTLRAEEIPDEEKNLGPQDRLIHVYHFMREPDQDRMLQNFGEPFLLVIRENETLGAIISRIQKKLEVPDEEISKWKFAYVSLGRPEYLKDDDVVAGRFQGKYSAWEYYLGLEHADT